MWFKRSPPPASLPRYVSHGGELVHPHPALCRGTRMLAFLLEADREALQALCDAWLNAPAAGKVRYVVPAPYVLLSYADIEHISPTDPRARDIGWVPETDVTFWVPTLCLRRVAGAWLPEHLAWFPPYLFVDDIHALVAGRELYGFNKTLGWFEKPSAFPDADRIAVEAAGFERFHPGTRGMRQPLLEITRLDGEPAPPRDGLAAVLDRLRQLAIGAGGGFSVPGLGRVMELSRLLAPNAFRMVFLKQFRDLHHIDRACYQAIVESTLSFPEIRGGGLLPARYQLTLRHLDSHPIARDLGLKGTGQPHTQTASLAMWSDFDFVLELGEERWSAPRPPEPSP